MADIFISYKREERTQVERLATALRGLGFSVWFDASLSAGETFSDEIDREVRGAKVVLVCWSPAAVSSRWVKAEAQIGFTKNNLISTRIAGPDGFEPPVPVNSVHMEDLRSWLVRPTRDDPAWKSVLRRAGVLADRADVADWAALPADAEAATVQAWIVKHGATSPLILEAEAALSQAQARGEARTHAEAAARERLARKSAERDAHQARATADSVEPQQSAFASVIIVEGKNTLRRTLFVDLIRSGIQFGAFAAAFVVLMVVTGFRDFDLNGIPPFIAGIAATGMVARLNSRSDARKVLSQSQSD